MISKKDLKNYEFRTIEGYFNYIIDSKINGNFSQVKDLFNKLNKEQKSLCLKYLNYDDEIRQETLKYLINQEVIL